MASITERELVDRLKSGNFGGAYLLYGNEVYLSRFYAERLGSKAVTGMEVFNIHRFSGAVKADELAGAVETLPMMSEYTFVEVCDYPFAQAGEADLKLIKELVEYRNESCVLIFRFENDQFNAKSSSKCRGVLEHFKKHGFAVELNRKETGELAQIICRRAASRGCNMQPTVARHLIDLCGVGLDNLLSEADKLFDYTGRRAITVEDVDAVAVKTLDASAYHLTKAICAGNSDKVMSICDDLINQRTEPIGIISALSATYVDMYRAKVADTQGIRPESIAKDFGYGDKTFKLKNAAQNVRGMPLSSVRESLDVLAAADVSLKNSVCDPITAVQEVLVRLIRIAAGQNT